MSARALPLLASLLAAWAVVLATRLPGASHAFAQGFAVLWLVRVLLASDGRPLVPRRVGILLLGLLLAAGLPYLLAQASGGDPHDFFLRLLGVLTCFLGVALLLPLAPFGVFWIVLLSTLTVAVTCSLDTDLVGALLLPGYVGLLALTLLLLERRLADAPAGAGAPAARVVLVDPGSRAGPALLRSAARLVLGGLALGALLWLVAPRPGEARREDGPRAASGAELTQGAGSGGGRTGSTGPDVATEDALLGAVEDIQQDKRVHWEVRLLAGEAEPPLLLREAERDLWLDPRGGAAPRWRSSRELERHPLVPASDGWVVVGDAAPGAGQRTLEARARLGVGLLFLEPEPLAFRVERPTGAEGEGPLAVLLDGTEAVGSGRLRRRVLAGDVVRMRSQPQRRDGADLLGRESSARVAPLASYGAIDAALAAQLRALTADVSGLASEHAWLKAQALERWLRGPGFEYALTSPVLAPGRRVVDFLTRVKRGNCEWYATALTLALRAHGMAARYVQGYWGGSHTPDSNLWTFYGAHYHAWTELFLDGIGWVPLNPTPPERLAEGADPRTGESRRAGEDEPTEAPGARVAPGERLRALVADLGRALARGGGALFGARTAYLGWVLAVAALGLAVWRLTRRSRGPAPAARGGVVGSAAAPYLEALGLLARRGLGRRPGWTAREHLERSRPHLPAEAAQALDTLARAHEQERYAGLAVPAAGSAQALERLRTAVRQAAQEAAARRAPPAPPAHRR